MPSAKQPPIGRSFIKDIMSGLILPVALICGLAALIYQACLYVTGVDAPSIESNRYLLFAIAESIGVFLITTTYITYIFGRTGTPVLGGIILLLSGLLFAPTKWFCLLALLDPFLTYYWLPPFRKAADKKK